MLAPSTLTSPPGSLSPQVDATLFAEFQAWRESPTLDKTCPFLERVYREDVGPCLDFTMQEVRRTEGGQKVGGDGGGKEGGVPAPQPLSRRPAPHRPTRRPALPQLSALVRAAVEDNTLTIEPVASQTLPAVKVAAVECGRAK